MNTVGIGYDVHRFAEGRPLILGGVTIEHSKGLDGHSDADVLCHAIADALLGAVGEPDIGHLFPNTDETIRGISSLKILETVASVIAAKNGKICNVDATLVAEAPKIALHLDGMKRKIGAALGLSPDWIGIKATTNERMGFLGRGEGIAAMAVASVERK